MNKKILGIFTTLLALAMLLTPVMAIGPENAEKNPNIVYMGYNVQLHSPSGVFNEWVNNPMTPFPVRVMVKDAAKFQIRNAIVQPAAGLVLATENKWQYLTTEIFEDFLVLVGLDPTYAAEAAAEYPAGVYIRLVLVGN